MENDRSSQTQDSQYTGPRFITIAEVMKKTTLSRPTVCRHIKNGTIPAVKIGSRVIIDAEFLDRLKEQSAISVKEDKNENN